MTPRPNLTPPQVVALRQFADMDPPRKKKPWPQTVAALHKLGLILVCGLSYHATPLGRVVAVMDGWIPSGDQQLLILALAEDRFVQSSVRYDLPKRAPATVLGRFQAAGLAFRGEDGLWHATTRGAHLAALLRGG